MMESIHQIGFHESTVVEVRSSDGTITLLLEGVHSGEMVSSASVQLTGIRSITRDGLRVDDLLFEYQDGEILTLERTPTGIHLIVEWTDFKNHRSITRSYNVECDSVQIEVHQ